MADRSVKRLICLFAGHRRIRYVTGVRLGTVTCFGDIQGQITSSEIRCLRCKRILA